MPTNSNILTLSYSAISDSHKHLGGTKIRMFLKLRVQTTKNNNTKTTFWDRNATFRNKYLCSLLGQRGCVCPCHCCCRSRFRIHTILINENLKTIYGCIRTTSSANINYYSRVKRPYGKEENSTTL